MNVAIRNRKTDQVIVRYEIHLADGEAIRPDQEYFDDAWQRAVSDRLVDAAHRDDYVFHLQPPKTLYESSR
jgi:hypothetical protein